LVKYRLDELRFLSKTIQS